MIPTHDGRPPEGGFAKLVPELLVENIREALRFWREALGFEIAYQRPGQGFAYLERPDGAQIMLCERAGVWETASLERPYGRGVMFQIHVASVENVIERLGRMGIPLYAARREVWRRYGDREGGRIEVVVQDPDGYLVMVAEHIGERPISSASDGGRAPIPRREQ